MSDQAKHNRVTLTRGGTIQLSNDLDKPSETTEEQREVANGVSRAIKAYRNAAQMLLRKKYAHLSQYAPAYLSNPGNIYVICCPEGAVIRYEQNKGEQRVLSGWSNESIYKLAAVFSEEVVFIGDYQQQEQLLNYGIEVTIAIEDPNGDVVKPLERARVAFHIRPESLHQKDNNAKANTRPHCAFSLKNSLVNEVFGTVMEESADEDEGQPFVARSIVRLPVGWECIEVYGPIDLDKWNEEEAAVWAENDILSTIVFLQNIENELNSLDPSLQSRKRYGKILQDYKMLLDSNPQREQELHAFLQANPILLCPTYTKYWSKLPIGSKVTDFVFRDALEDYLLVELERSSLPLFIKDGHVSSELNHARGQIIDWKRYIEDNLATVQRELGLKRISSNPRSLIVIGRSSSLSINNRRKLTAMENDSPKIKILTYDDIYELAKATLENILGPFWHTDGDTEIYYLPNQ